MRSGSGKPRRFGRQDLIVGGVVLALAAFIAVRVGTALDYRWDWSGVGAYILRFDPEEERWVPNLLLLGFLTTVRMAIWGSLLAAAIGLVFGLFRVSASLFQRLLGWAFVEFIRNLPPLVFLFIFFFFISSQIMPLLRLDELVRNASPETLAVVSFLFGRPELLENFVSGVVALAIFEAAYVTEIVRAGIRSIPRGQWEAAHGLGLGRIATFARVIAPQATRRVVPPLANQFISLIKDSSIVSLISIQELTFAGSEVLVVTQRVFEVWITVALMYFAVSFVFSLAFGRLERRMAMRGGGRAGAGGGVGAAGSGAGFRTKAGIRGGPAPASSGGAGAGAEPGGGAGGPRR